MRTIARFITRPSSGEDAEKGPTDLFLGACWKGQDYLKPHTIYEIREILGELTIVELGPSHLARGSWAQEIGSLLETVGKYLFLTFKECSDLIWRQERERDRQLREEHNRKVDE